MCLCQNLSSMDNETYFLKNNQLCRKCFLFLHAPKTWTAPVDKVSQKQTLESAVNTIPETTPKRPRTRACSYCKKTRHFKSKGKEITCPKLLAEQRINDTSPILSHQTTTKLHNHHKRSCVYVERRREKSLGGIHKQVSVTLNIKLTLSSGGGLAHDIWRMT